MKDFYERLADAAIGEGLSDVVYAEVNTAIGSLLIASTERGICRISFAEEDASETLADLADRIGVRVIRSPKALVDARERLAAYVEGEDVDIAMPVDMTLVRSDFHRLVLTELQKVGRGDVTTYGMLAKRIGHPKAARATGTALARNPIPIVVPCHRVLPSTGIVGNYGGQPWRKQYLLEIEGWLGELPHA